MNEIPRIAAILAGGNSMRMGKCKATIKLNHLRLIDHVIAQLENQVDRIVISGPQSYSTGLEAIADSPDVSGPVAGLFGIRNRLASALPDACGFMSVPVDGPFCPNDLYARLNSPTNSTYAVTSGGRPHPTFAYWRCADLDQALESRPHSLFALTRTICATPVPITPDHACFNINTPADLNAAMDRLLRISDPLPD